MDINFWLIFGAVVVPIASSTAGLVDWISGWLRLPNGWKTKSAAWSSFGLTREFGRL